MEGSKPCKSCKKAIYNDMETYVKVVYYMTDKKQIWFFCSDCPYNIPLDTRCFRCEGDNGSIHFAYDFFIRKRVWKRRLIYTVCSSKCAKECADIFVKGLGRFYHGRSVCSGCKKASTSTYECEKCGLPYCSVSCLVLHEDHRKRLCKKRVDHRLYKCSLCSIEMTIMKVCGKCKKVRYCSEECQKEDWTAHKSVCKK